jgi:hypothetical protein
MFRSPAADHVSGNEKPGKLMQQIDQMRTGLRWEIQIVPWWAWALGAVAFLSAQWYFIIALAHQPNPFPSWCRPLLGLLAGTGGVLYLASIGYISRDSKRRGMSPVLWTLVAILVPNLLGILLYFVLRQPRLELCPQCGMAVQTGFNFCPRCSQKLAPTCPQCQGIVAPNDAYCPHCGTSLRSEADRISSSPTRPIG